VWGEQPRCQVLSGKIRSARGEGRHKLRLALAAVGLRWGGSDAGTREAGRPGPRGARGGGGCGGLERAEARTNFCSSSCKTKRNLGR
jgi:hypothetical protein